MDSRGKVILITGGTGSFGKKFTEIALRKLSPKAVRIYSRDELKQFEMQRDARFQDSRLRYFIGDVRDEARLQRAMEGVDLVIHAAAMKHVTACEFNPFEAVKTNVLGAQNVIEAALNLSVSRVMAVSTDKAANPVNLYGATKLCAEKMFTSACSYVGEKDIRLSCVRYGNVAGSRGSVMPLFLSQRESGKLTITDGRMTRFWVTLEQAVGFVLASIERMRGGEVFIPKIPSARVTDLADVIAPQAEKVIVGIRPGEKIHEVLLTEDEGRIAREFDTFFVVEPRYPGQSAPHWNHGKSLPDGYRYSSDTNPWRLTHEELRRVIGEVEVEIADNGNAGYALVRTPLQSSTTENRVVAEASGAK